MALPFVTCGLVGAFMSFRFRVQTVLAASALIALIEVFVGSFGGIGISNVIVCILLYIGMLQYGYIFGLATTFAIRKFVASSP